jgi:hypothetical protein
MATAEFNNGISAGNVFSNCRRAQFSDVIISNVGVAGAVVGVMGMAVEVSVTDIAVALAGGRTVGEAVVFSTEVGRQATRKNRVAMANLDARRDTLGTPN